ncbi:Transposase (putative), gypsy type [Corchorus capsularis]|uniref:Transposase (Putative), gypsy type n=1 Tax=Corchorus capsularis TaxID=210143 RepID=A0A1R3G877_COCAP|nr:Transposase (putative), gypsy type [Corchorus capsularis]
MDPKQPKELIEEAIGQYDERCKRKFGDCSNYRTRFLPSAANDVGLVQYKCMCQAGLCSGAHGFQVFNCSKDDRAYNIHCWGRQAFFYKLMFDYGFRLPAHPFIKQFLDFYGVAASQFVPNTWKIVISYLVISIYKGWKPSMSTIRCLFQVQKRGLGWYTLQARQGRKNKLKGPESNRKWKSDFVGIEVSQGTDWSVPVQWRSVRVEDKNEYKSLVLSEEEQEQILYMQNHNHTVEDLCHRTRLYLCLLAPAPDFLEDFRFNKGPKKYSLEPVGPLVFGSVPMIINGRGDDGLDLMIPKSEGNYYVYNLIDGERVLEPNIEPPMFSPEDFSSETAVGKNLVLLATLAQTFGKVKTPPPAIDGSNGDGISFLQLFLLFSGVSASFAEEEMDPAAKKASAAAKAFMEAKFQEKNQSKKRPAPTKPPPTTPAQKKANTRTDVVVVVHPPVQVVSTSKGAPRGSTSCTGDSSKSTPRRDDRPITRKHAAVPTGQKAVDFLADLMERSLKPSVKEDVELVKRLSNEERAAGLLACVNQVCVFAHQLLEPYRPSLLRKDKKLVDLLDESTPTTCAKEARELRENVIHYKRGQDETARDLDTLRMQHSALQKSFDDLDAQHQSILESLKSESSLRQKEKGDFEVYKIQKETEVNDLKVLLDETKLMCDALATEGVNFANSKVAEVLAKIKERHPKLDLSEC